MVKESMTLPIGINGTFESKANSPYKQGDIAIITCNLGYVSNGKISEYVMKDGKLQWIPPSIECVPISCGPPPPIDNGRVIGNVFSFPQSVHYECDLGYKLNSFMNYYCNTSGEWTPKIKNVSCIPVKCDELKNPENGRVTYYTRDYGSIATYKCNAGYKLSGKDTRTCLENGLWSDQEPKCEDIVFKLPLPPVVSKPLPQPPPNLQPPVLNHPPNLPPHQPPKPPSVSKPHPPVVPNPLPSSQSKNVIIAIYILLMILPFVIVIIMFLHNV